MGAARLGDTLPPPRPVNELFAFGGTLPPASCSALRLSPRPNVIVNIQLVLRIPRWTIKPVQLILRIFWRPNIPLIWYILRFLECFRQRRFLDLTVSPEECGETTDGRRVRFRHRGSGVSGVRVSQQAVGNQGMEGQCLTLWRRNYFFNLSTPCI